MFIDEKGRLFGKVNLLDIFFVLLFIAAILVVVMLFGGKSSNTSTLPVTYTLEVRNEEASYFDNVHVGEQVVDGVTKARMGKIVGFTKKQAHVLEQANNKMAIFTPEGRYDGYITIQVDATVAYPDLMSNGQPIKIGEEVAYRSESLAMRGYIVAIDYDEETLRGMK